jgi:hypothetical protein
VAGARRTAEPMTPALLLLPIGLIVVLSLPWWLPNRVIRCREAIFTWINGIEGIPVPGPLIGAEHFERLYSNPAADGRSRGAGLSDLFWYWLAPGPQMHQEHLEPGERYRAVARVTRQVLALPLAESAELAARCARRVLDELPDRELTPVRLRDLMMPIWAQVYYELVFAEPCPPAARRLISDNADDVVTALKGCSLRHLGRRERLTRYLLDRLRAGEVPVRLPGEFTDQESAFYLQGAFFNTAVVQMSEAMAHLMLIIAQHPPVQRELLDHLEDDDLWDRVIDETLRVHPLFGIAHRITSAPIALDDDVQLPAGSVLLFNYLAHQRTGPAGDGDFRPERWLELKRKDAHFIPFGVTANRACPARGVAPVMMRAAGRELLRRYTLASSVGHTRSLPSRGPCLLIRRGVTRSARGRLARMWVRDRWDDVALSLTQLVLGSYMVWDARRQRLCADYFATELEDAAP